MSNKITSKALANALTKATSDKVAKENANRVANVVKKAHATIENAACAKVFALANVNLDTVFACDVNAIDKQLDIVNTIATESVVKKNVYNIAIARCIAAICNDGLTFTRIDAQDACSAHRVSNDKRKQELCAAIKNQDTVSETTVSPQHGSTLTALLNLNVIKQTSIGSRNATYAIADTEIAKKYLEILSK